MAVAKRMSSMRCASDSRAVSRHAEVAQPPDASAAIAIGSALPAAASAKCPEYRQQTVGTC
jgi:hypothetical protein